jgi:nucleoside-diphosphate-sugar epimerase
MILVTGANGFVGRALVPRLAQDGPVRIAIRRCSLPSVPPAVEAAKAELVALDDSPSPADWSRAVAGVTTVIHLAARVHVMQESEADPLAAFRRVNVEATRSLAEAAAQAGVRRFVFVSSIKVNGEATGAVPFRAEDPPQPQDPYGV